MRLKYPWVIFYRYTSVTLEWLGEGNGVGAARMMYKCRKTITMQMDSKNKKEGGREGSWGM